MPAAAKNHFRLAGLKIDAVRLGIEKIDAAAQGGFLQFGDDTRTDPLALVGLVQNQGDVYRLSGAHRLQFRLDLEDPARRFRFLEELLDTLASTDVQTVEEAC